MTCPSELFAKRSGPARAWGNQDFIPRLKDRVGLRRGVFGSGKVQFDGFLSSGRRVHSSQLNMGQIRG